MRELKRIIFDRGTLFMLVLLTAIGSVLFWLSSTRTNVSKEYPEVYTECYHRIIDELLTIDDPEERAARIDEIYDRSLALGGVAMYIKLYGEGEELDEFLAQCLPMYTEMYLSGEYKPYLDEPTKGQAEREACEALREQLTYLSDFNSYYPTIKKNAERMQHTSIFGDPDSFAYRNTLKTVKDFAPIEGSEGTLGDDRAITKIFEDPIVDLLMLLFMAAVCVIMLKERKSGLWQLVRAAPAGRARIALWRILALFICSIIATVFIFGSRIAVSYRLFSGMSYCDRLIQSVPGFNGVTVPMKVNTFLGIYCAIKVFCTFGAGLMLYLLLSLVKNTNIAIAVTALVLASEYTLYSAVRDSSILVPFKYVNIFQLIIPKGFTVSYMNLNLFEHPVNARVAVGVVMAALSLLSAIGIVLVHVKKRPVGKPDPIEKVIDRLRSHTYKRTALPESRKVMLAQRGIAVLALLVLVWFSFDKLPEPSVDNRQRYVTSYYFKYAGSVNEETLASIDEDYEEINELMLATDDGFMRLSYRNTLEGLEYLKEDVADIIARNASGEYPYEIKLLPPYTYMIAFGSRSQEFESVQGLKALLCICLLTAGMYAYERQSSMVKLLRSLPGGRRKLFRKKQLLTLLFTFLVFAAVYLPEILAEAGSDVYRGFAYASFPMQGLEVCRDSGLPLSVGALTVLFYLLRFAMLYLVGSAVGLLSSLCEKVNSSVVLVCSAFVVPACIVAMGVEDLFGFTALPLLWGSDLLFRGKPWPFIAYLLICLGLIAANYAINCAPRTLRAKRTAASDASDARPAVTA